MRYPFCHPHVCIWSSVLSLGSITRSACIATFPALPDADANPSDAEPSLPPSLADSGDHADDDVTSGSADEAACAAEDASVSSHDAAVAAGDDGSGDEVASKTDSLTAPTLRLGEHTSSDDEVCQTVGDASDSISESDASSARSEFPCSQVSSGWMGKAISRGNALEKKEQAKRVLEGCLRDLESDLRVDEKVDVEFLPEYLRYCRRSLQAYGSCAYTTLVSGQHFLQWLGLQKSKDCPQSDYLKTCHMYFHLSNSPEGWDCKTN